MKKLLFPFIAFLLISCSNLSEKLESAISKDTGSKAIIKKNSEKRELYSWDNVSVKKSQILKNTVDRTLEVMPIKESDFQNDIDNLGNAISGQYIKYYSWETSKIEVELDFVYTDIDKENMQVKLYVTSK